MHREVKLDTLQCCSYSVEITDYGDKNMKKKGIEEIISEVALDFNGKCLNIMRQIFLSAIKIRNFIWHLNKPILSSSITSPKYLFVSSPRPKSNLFLITNREIGPANWTAFLQLCPQLKYDAPDCLPAPIHKGIHPSPLAAAAVACPPHP